ncbi:MAG: succinate dehydrogenase, hydrophobic membrane anchor protein [Gemmatimonas sp.]
MSMRTPLGRVRGLGSAKEGVHHWWVQRLTAVALVPLMLWFVASLIQLAGADYAHVTAWVAQPVVAVLLLLLFVSGFYHLSLGLQVVVEDYVHEEPARIVSLVVVRFACWALAAVAVFSVLKIAFRG